MLPFARVAVWYLFLTHRHLIAPTGATVTGKSSFQVPQTCYELHKPWFCCVFFSWKSSTSRFTAQLLHQPLGVELAASQRGALAVKAFGLPGGPLAGQHQTATTIVTVPDSTNVRLPLVGGLGI